MHLTLFLWIMMVVFTLKSEAKEVIWEILAYPVLWGLLCVARIVDEREST